MPLDNRKEAYFHGDVRHSSHNNGGLVARDDPMALGYDPSLQFDPAITEVNLRAGVRMGGIDASVFVNNLFEEEYRVYAFDSSLFAGVVAGVYAKPRTYGVTASFRFGAGYE